MSPARMCSRATSTACSYEPSPIDERTSGISVRSDAAVGRRSVELHLVAAHHHGEGGIAPDEGEPPPPLTVLHRFEEEGCRVVGGCARELHEGGDGRLEVGEHLAPYRHHGVVPGEGDE